MNGEAGYFDNNELTQFNSFGVKHMSDKARKTRFQINLL